MNDRENYSKQNAGYGLRRVASAARLYAAVLSVLMVGIPTPSYALLITKAEISTSVTAVTIDLKPLLNLDQDGHTESSDLSFDLSTDDFYPGLFDEGVATGSVKIEQKDDEFAELTKGLKLVAAPNMLPLDQNGQPITRFSVTLEIEGIWTHLGGLITESMSLAGELTALLAGDMAGFVSIQEIDPFLGVLPNAEIVNGPGNEQFGPPMPGYSRNGQMLRGPESVTFYDLLTLEVEIVNAAGHRAEADFSDTASERATVVPEPGTLGMLLSGLILLGVIRLSGVWVRFRPATGENCWNHASSATAVQRTSRRGRWFSASIARSRS